MRSILVSLLTALTFSAMSQPYQPNWASLDNRPVPEWYQDAKFGIFIHWGVYSVPSYAPKDVSLYARYAEWYWKRLVDSTAEGHAQFVAYHNRVWGEDFKYPDFVQHFKAELFEPTDWATLFKKAGARYVVLTSKHHDGFALWPSAQSWNWNAVDVGPHRDLAGDLMQAVRAEGLRMGYYYSLYEWFNPLYQQNPDRYVEEHMLPQLNDLVTRYKPDLVWTDGEWDLPSERWHSPEWLAWLYNESPVKRDVVVNDRWGKETRSKHGGFYTTEYGLVHNDEQSGQMARPWEECRGIGHSFGYSRAEEVSDYQSSKDLIHLLVGLVGRGGNLLLNIGPTADGRIPVIMQQRLLDMGTWLEANGEAIYGTRMWTGSAANEQEGVFFTQKGADLYVLCTQYPATLRLKGVAGGKVRLLGREAAVKTKQSGGQLTITPPAILPLGDARDYAFVFKIEGGAGR
ncbi:alpha-L-fucosidase [Catalinimonas alkaloidigena]|uniref:alpha-L-fucosidase n=1 Tax=Catalinimonas alkaloidigena TaxID=1075417 RepID=A0A1G9BAH5_9BACT|nr:alpha-L-fucosidase [Catalinimonas alkaloidigena]SDK36572.1 alpha-L-fucosidase [Catalinimonas alkaloidigena]